MLQVLRISLILAMALGVAACAAEPEKPQNEWEHWGSFNPSYQFVFFAVLEGLYFDGVSNEAVDAIIPVDAQGFRRMTEHFVYACPLCAPVKDALNLYRSRPAFAHQKPLRFEEGKEGHPVPVYRDTFGKGLSAEVMKGLTSAVKKERLATLQTLVQKWVQRRMDSQHLSADERKVWTTKFEAMSKDGEKYLKEWIGAGERAKGMGFDYSGWTETCPSCSGAVKGGMVLKP